jgi:hypothetical protein
MSGAIPPLSQHAFMAWCSVKAQGQLYLFLLQHYKRTGISRDGFNINDSVWEIKKQRASQTCASRNWNWQCRLLQWIKMNPPLLIVHSLWLHAMCIQLAHPLCLSKHTVGLPWFSHHFKHPNVSITLPSLSYFIQEQSENIESSVMYLCF